MLQKLLEKNQEEISELAAKLELLRLQRNKLYEELRKVNFGEKSHG